MLFEKMEKIACDTTIKATSKSINQTQRNALNAELTKALLDMLVKNADNDNGVYLVSDYVSVGQIDSKTIEFAIDNEKVGIIPVKISVSIPNFDTDLDLYARVDEYQETLNEKALKLAEKEKEKALKIKADQERREKQKALREQAEKRTE